MANKHHLSLILRQDQEAWNRWREQHPDICPDFSNAILTGFDLTGFNLSGAILIEAGLARADLRRANLTGANLASARLTRTNLAGADFTSADLTDADLANAILDWTNLTDTNLASADLTYANIGRAALIRANLASADLTGAKLFYSDLTEADLRGATLIGADLIGADLTSAALTDADLREATATDAVLDHAQLTGAKLWEVRRGGWSIRGIVCRRVFWDREGIEPSDFEEGEFEHLYTEKPRIRLRYPGGMSLADIAMLPLIIERLQVKHPGCALRIHSLEEDPLRWPAADELRPVLFRSGGEAEDPVDEGPLRRHVVGWHEADLSLGQHRHRLHPRQGSPGGPEAAEAEHRPCPALDPPVVLLDPVVEPPPAPVLDEPPQLAFPLHLAERAGVALEPVGDDGPRVAGVLPAKCLAEEALGRPLAPLGAQQEVDGLPRPVDGPVEVAPLPADSHVGLVDVPRPAARPQVPPRPLLELGREALDPTIERDVVDLDPTVGEHPLEVTVADGELQVPAQRPEDDLGREAKAAEGPGVGHARCSRMG
jgi:uncharacterized protein YjbI with pentapeptide repeats